MWHIKIKTSKWYTKIIICRLLYANCMQRLVKTGQIYVTPNYATAHVSLLCSRILYKYNTINGTATAGIHQRYPHMIFSPSKNGKRTWNKNVLWWLRHEPKTTEWAQGFTKQCIREMFLRLKKSWHNTISVSYTHLDVYKRQVLLYFKIH